MQVAATDRSKAMKGTFPLVPSPILPRWYVGPNTNYPDSTNIKKRKQRAVGMGCTDLDSGLTSGSVSEPISFLLMTRLHLLSAQANPAADRISSLWQCCWQDRLQIGFATSDHRLPILNKLKFQE